MAIQVAIEGYDSLEQIGIGGMAAVYKARKVSIDKTVAIKVLFPYLATDQSYIERFHREAKAAASIQHENIVNVVDFGESEGAFYIVMEYYDGYTLEHLMKSRPGVPTDIALQILLEVASGLEAAHALDIVHRDIKPANIICTSQGGIKIADFGLARKSDSVTVITQMGKVIGTPAYMSPEQAAGRPVGPASDLFSLGVVGYELLSRRKPFEGKTYSEVLEKIQTCEPPPVSNANPLITPEFEQIIRRMLAKDERERHPSANALIAELEAAMEKYRFSRDRRRLSSYVKDPDSYDAAFNEKTIAQCLSRGAYFMQKGQGHLEDAVLEFRRILFLDPDNERARRNIDRIRAERGEGPSTVAIDVLQVMPGSARTTPAPEADGEPDASLPRRGVPRWVYGAGATLLAIAAVALWWTSRGPARDGNGTASRPPASADRVETAATGDAERAAPDLPSPAGTGAAEAGNEPKPDAGARGGREAEKTMSAAIAPAGAHPAAPAETGKDAGPSSSAAPGKSVSERRTGTLSVFFLGGVGELWIDGKPFAHQPPFEAVALAAGTYRVACRMSGDAVPREFTVTVQSGAHTVIEYEVGGAPVVTTNR